MARQLPSDQPTPEQEQEAINHWLDHGDEPPEWDEPPDGDVAEYPSFKYKRDHYDELMGGLSISYKQDSRQNRMEGMVGLRIKGKRELMSDASGHPIRTWVSLDDYNDVREVGHYLASKAGINAEAVIYFIFAKKREKISDAKKNTPLKSLPSGHAQMPAPLIPFLSRMKGADKTLLAILNHRPGTLIGIRSLMSTGLKRTSVKEHLRLLTRWGFIEIETQHDQSGAQLANRISRNDYYDPRVISNIQSKMTPSR